MKTAYENSKKLIQNVVPSMAYSGQGESWKLEAREKLSALLGMEKFQKVDPQLQVEYEEKIDGATELRFTYASE